MSFDMSQAPSMPVFTDALLGDTLHLSAEEFGAYCLILFATWRNNGKALPDDAMALSQICRVTPQRWRSHMRHRLAGFFNIDDGRWHQKRLEKEWEYVQHRAEVKRQNGSLGGRPRKPKDNLPDNLNVTDTEPNQKLDESTQAHTQAKKLASLASSEELPRGELHRAWAKAAAAERSKAGLPEVDLRREWVKFLTKADEPTEARWLAWAMKARAQRPGNGSTDPSGILPEPPWPQRCRGWAKGYRWHADWGPQPGEPGCWAPSDLVAEAVTKRSANGAA
jgi:uncharacterized protein YdaU (DUF1376 family)